MEKKARGRKRLPIKPGDVFGKLKVLSLDGVRDGHAVYICECECGKLTKSRGANLKSGGKISCGCSVGNFTARPGAMQNLARLTDEAVLLARRLYHSGSTLAEVEREILPIHVTPSTLFKAISGKTWTHLPLDGIGGKG